MSEKLGPLAYGTKEEEIFLGREITKHKDYSEQTAQDIDSEIKSIITKCMHGAEKILSDNIDILHKLSSELLEREILDAEEIDKIIKGEDLPPLKRNGADSSSPKQEEVPEHVKKMLEEKKLRQSEKNSEKADGID